MRFSTPASSSASVDDVGGDVEGGLLARARLADRSRGARPPSMLTA